MLLLALSWLTVPQWFTTVLIDAALMDTPSAKGSINSAERSQIVVMEEGDDNIELFSMHLMQREGALFLWKVRVIDRSQKIERK